MKKTTDEVVNGVTIEKLYGPWVLEYVPDEHREQAEEPENTHSIAFHNTSKGQALETKDKGKDGQRQMTFDLYGCVVSCVTHRHTDARTHTHTALRRDSHGRHVE